MRELRPDAHTSSEMDHQLILRQLPTTKKIFFEAGTEDALIFKRKTPLAVEEEFKQMHRAELDFQSVLKKRQKTGTALW